MSALDPRIIQELIEMRKAGVSLEEIGAAYGKNRDWARAYVRGVPCPAGYTSWKEYGSRANRARENVYYVSGDEVIISLPCGRHTTIDLGDASLVDSRQWKSVRANCKREKFYVVSSSKHDRVPLHRYLLGLSSQDPGQVDHIDGNSLNNRRANLRVCTSAQNNWNRSKVANKSGFRGVRRASSGKYYGYLRVHGEYFYTPHFSEAADAARARDALAITHHGDFAVLNFEERA